MKNRLDQDFTLGGLLYFALPTTIMMLVTSLYTIVDGVLTSRLVGENALASINIAYPAISAMLAVGIMLGTGGSAVVGNRMGAGDMAGARRTFGFLALVGVCAGGVFTLAGCLGAEQLAGPLGASDVLMADTVTYLRIQLFFAPMAMLQLMFQSFFVTAGLPGLGLWLSIAAGVSNGVLDWLFMGPMKMGIAGAAAATVIGYCIPAVVGSILFLTRRQGLHFGRPELQWRLLGKACFNGSSEMVTNLSTAVTTFFFNIIMLELLGEPGVAAITIVLYAQFLLVALFLGFSIGVAPIFSFNQGAERDDRQRSLFRHCARFILVASVGTLLASLALATVIVGVFSPKGTQVYDLALYGFRLFIPTFLFSGVNIFASALFTALGDGTRSAVISFARTFGFLMAGLLLLPRLLGVPGVWLAVPVAEALSCVLSGLLLWRNRSMYGWKKT